MSTDGQQPAEDDREASGNSSALLLKNHETRIAALEKTSHTTFFKKITESASASALFLGLVLTFVTLHDAFISKPEADRISRLSQFNQAVNSAAHLRQELIKSQFESTNPQLQLAMASHATPQILNNISTARAMLRDLKNEDVGIPQLIILISEAYNAGDIENAKAFAARAVAKTDVSSYMHSEAKRYEGKLLFAGGDPVGGRQSFEAAIASLGDTASTLPARAFVLADMVLSEYSNGDCANAAAEFQRLSDMIKELYNPVRQQIGGTVKAQLIQLQARRCPTPQNLDALMVN